VRGFATFAHGHQQDLRRPYAEDGPKDVHNPCARSRVPEAVCFEAVLREVRSGCRLGEHRFPTASTPSAFGNPDGRPVTSNDISPRLSSTPTSPRLRPRQSCPEDDRRPRICCTATRVLALTETADATKPPGVSTSDTPPACAASLRLHANGAGEKLAVLTVRGLASPVMSLARTFTARAKARARRLQLLVACDVGSDTAVGQAATSNAAARTGMRAARVTAG
jgi:hypothetical protein